MLISCLVATEKKKKPNRAFSECVYSSFLLKLYGAGIKVKCLKPDGVPPGFLLSPHTL